jgi:hypothetical protein
MKRLKLTPITEQQAPQLEVYPAYAGFKIPYFTLAGAAHPTFFRYRFLQNKPTSGWGSATEPNAADFQKYTQPAHTSPEVYFPPLLEDQSSWTDVAKDPATSVVITEGELKAACACIHGAPTIGLGGVWSFQSAKLGYELLPDLEAFNWKKRKVIICYDSDLATKSGVKLAMYRLTKLLTNRGAAVHHAFVPAEGSAKLGLDDFIIKHGMPDFAKLLIDAPEATYSEAIHRMNQKVAYIRSTQEVLEMATSTVMKAKTFTEVAYKPETYIESSVDAKGKSINTLQYTAKKWLECEYRNEVTRLIYEPGQPRITDALEYNLWRPPTIQPVKGSIAPWEKLLNNIFKGAPADHIMWVRRWLAAPLRWPGVKVRSSLLVWSQTERTGKGMLGVTMKRLYGDNFHKTSDEILFSRFGYWAHGHTFIMIDEIEPKTKYEVSGKLKDLITRDEITIEMKMSAPYTTRDCLVYYFTSNEQDAIKLSQQDCRFFVWESMAPRVTREDRDAYFHWLDKEGGAEHLLHYLTKELNMGDFDCNEGPPVTASKAAMIESGLAELPYLCHKMYVDLKSELPASVAKRHLFTPKDILGILDGDGKKRWTQNYLSRCLKKAGFKLSANGTNNAKAHGAREYMWALCRHQECESLSARDATALYNSKWPNRHNNNKFEQLPRNFVEPKFIEEEYVH